MEEDVLQLYTQAKRKMGQLISFNGCNPSDSLPYQQHGVQIWSGSIFSLGPCTHHKNVGDRHLGSVQVQPSSSIILFLTINYDKNIYIHIYIPVSSSSSSCWVCWLILIREYICERDRSGKDCPRERAFLWDSHRPCKDRNFCITVGAGERRPINKLIIQNL